MKRFCWIQVIILVLSGVLAACSSDSGSETGTVTVTLQDTPANVEKLEVTLSEVSVHFVPQGNSEDEDGDQNNDGDSSDYETAGSDIDKPAWVNILSEEEATFDLILLKDNPTVLGSIELGEGKITQIRLYLSETTAPVATIDGIEHPVTVPSGKIKLVGQFDIVADHETVIRLDFDAAESLKENANGYRLQPTIKIVAE